MKGVAELNFPVIKLEGLSFGRESARMKDRVTWNMELLLGWGEQIIFGSQAKTDSPFLSGTHSSSIGTLGQGHPTLTSSSAAIQWCRSLPWDPHKSILCITAWCEWS